MKCRKLRIAWSVVWGVAAVLLLVLWVRSYRWCDSLESPFGVQFVNLYGTFQVAPLENFLVVNEWHVASNHFAELPGSELVTVSETLLAFQIRPHLVLPAWFVSAAVAAFASVPWLPLKPFSLRTLFIATTLVAALLGLVVWAAR